MRSRVPAVEAWVALALAGAGAFLVAYLWRNPAGTPLFGVSPNTLPLGTAAIVAVLAGVLAVQALRRPPAPAAAPPGRRVPALVALSVAYAAVLPWLGYLLASAVFIAATAWLFGARRPAVLAGLAVLVPLAIVQFFERAMVIYLPAGRLF